ncbi:hypothetical protein [Bradyrhizobium sp. th.b2]|uniref:hypothetical protein n=1 Tax=Bradyrhizobium sp. th-b2 TaxID=172088 RepID=UPI000412A3FB|nr:hypothetical protein [Bradyrhizobium sp. th.b2]
MAVPAFPIANAVILKDGFGLQRMRDPIATDMEQGNMRQRARPGDNVGTVTQTVRFYAADYDTFAEWVKTTLNLGTARFTIDVWLGTSLANKVCQFVKPGTTLVASWPNPGQVDVRMTLRVYDV